MLSSHRLAACVQRCLTRGATAVTQKSTAHKSSLLACSLEQNLRCRTLKTMCGYSHHSDISRGSCPTGQPTRGMAGHSKWANIRHIKAAKDGEKQKMASKIAQRIRVVVRGRSGLAGFVY